MSRGYGRTTSPTDAVTDNLPIAAALGAGAFVVNYVLMYLFAMIDGVDAGEGGSMWKLVGNFVYNAQFVPTEISGGGQSVTVNYVTGSSSSEFLSAFLQAVATGDTVPVVVYHAAPFIVLLATGALVASVAGSRLNTAGAAAVGASIAVGTVVLSIVGVFLFKSSSGSTGTAAPKLIMGVLLVGIVFPAVCGAIGGAIGNEL